MLGFVAYFRELGRLTREAPRNPLISVATPFTQGRFPRVVAIIQIALASLFFAGVQVFGVLPAIFLELGGSGSRYGPPDPLEATIPLLFLCVIIAPVITYPVNLLFFSGRWTRRQRIEELVVTPLSVRELSFGSLFWGILLGCVFPLTAFFGLCESCIVLGTIEVLSGDSFDEESLIFVAILILMLCYIIAVCGLSIKLWFHMTHHPWPILLILPLLVVVYLFCTIFFMVFVFETFLDFRFNDFVSMLTSFLFMAGTGLFMAIHMLRSAGKLAPSLYLRVYDMKPFMDYSVVANLGYRVYNREIRQNVRETLREYIPLRFFSNIQFPLLAFFLCSPFLGTIFLLRTIFPDVNELSNLWNSFLLLIFLTVSNYLTIRIRAARSEFKNAYPVVSGAPLTSFLRPLVPTWLVFTFGSMLLILLFEGVHNPIGLFFSVFYIFLFAQITFILNVLLLVRAFTPGLARLFWKVFYFAVPIVFWIWTAISSKSHGDFFLPNTHHGQLEATAIFLAVIIAYNGISILQTLFDRVVRGTPMGRVAWLPMGKQS